MQDRRKGVNKEVIKRPYLIEECKQYLAEEIQKEQICFCLEQHREYIGKDDIDLENVRTEW